MSQRKSGLYEILMITYGANIESVMSVNQLYTFYSNH